MFKSLLTKLKHLIPGCCLLCNQRSNTGFDLCTLCLQALPVLGDCCRHCGAPLCSEALNTRCCGTCLCKPPSFDNTLVPFLYQDPIIPLVAKLKFHRNLSVGRLLGSLMAQHIKQRTMETMPSLLVPVPLHPKRLRQRGYNQAIIIAEHLSYQLDIPLTRTQCKRIRNTATQTQINAKHRSANVNNAFVCSMQNPPTHVAIVDDVMTTGATVNEVSKALKKAGVAKVSVWCCARTNLE